MKRHAHFLSSIVSPSFVRDIAGQYGAPEAKTKDLEVRRATAMPGEGRPPTLSKLVGAARHQTSNALRSHQQVLSNLTDVATAPCSRNATPHG